VKIDITNGAMQKIPFDFNATVLNLPNNLNVQWYIDGNLIGSTQYSFEEEGTYYVTAKVTDASNTIVKVLHTDIVAYNTKLVTSFTATANNDSSKYVYSDANSTLSGVFLDVPKESLLQDTLIELKESKAPNIPNLGRASISKVLTLEPSGLEFEVPILVSMPYIGNIKKENILIARYSDGGVVDTLLPYSVDEESKIVKFKTNHFTSFSLQESYFIDKPIYEQTDIQRIITLTGIRNITDNDEWEKILNTVIEEKGDYRVYDMFLEYDKQLRMSEKIADDKYSEALKVMFPDKGSTLGKQIEMTKSMVDILEIADNVLNFNPRTLVSGGTNLAKEIIEFGASLLGLPTSILDVAEVTNYIPKPIDTLEDAFFEIDNVLYRTLWSELNEILVFSENDESNVMAYNAKEESVLASFMGGDGALISNNMIHNLKLMFLKNKHFQDYKATYLENLITTIRYYHESEEKSVILLQIMKRIL